MPQAVLTIKPNFGLLRGSSLIELQKKKSRIDGHNRGAVAVL
jgi:hypothetical protein